MFISSSNAVRTWATDSLLSSATRGLHCTSSTRRFFYKAFTGFSNQLRNTTRQNEYLVGIPINCVVQAFNAVLEDFGRYVRTKTNATIPFEEFEAGMAATLDIKPQQAVMGAYTDILLLALRNWSSRSKLPLSTDRLYPPSAGALL